VIRGIVLAAGASTRMGQAKAALPFGQTGETVLSRVVRTLLRGGVPDVIVVAGAHIDAVRTAMPSHEPRARVIEHVGWSQGQLSSLLKGLEAIDDPLLEAAVVTLVDVPLVLPSTVAAVIAAWRQSGAPIVRPSARAQGAQGAQGAEDTDRHGHPVVFDRSVFADLRAADLDAGAKAVFAKHQERVVNVEVQDPGAFEDIDTPGQYDDLRSQMAD
jgi:molybdenum cofactor cytidylyltransferase